MAPAPTTCPNVGELKVVSVEVKWTVLKTLLAERRTSRPCISFSWMFFAMDISNETVPGPIMMLRPALPNTPAGVTKAALLNHAWMVGSLSWIDCPGTKSGRAAPVTPRLRSDESPKNRGENGRPEASVRLPLKENPLKALCAQPLLFSHFLSLPKGSS